MFHQEERDISTFLRKVILKVALIVASPFFMLAFLFLLLQKPPLWSLVPLAAGLLLVAAGLAVWLVARMRLRAVRRELERLGDNDILRPRT
ncbi:MAG TPA: hypothetical protein VM582_03455 [Candidatus Thermoplasmatota archaeon]|nr:hypothetical protein [Candidatus Thermoplasmatota archaeon]